MRHRILLAEQHLRRGFDANALIASYAESEKVCTRLTLTGTQLCNHIISFEPHVVYYPWVTPYVYRFLRDRNDRIPLVNAFQEQNVVLHSPNSARVQFAAVSDYIFVWGEAQKRKCEELFSRPEVVVTGNPRFDPYFDASIAAALYPSRSQLAKQYNLNNEQPWILLALDFSLITTNTRRELRRRINKGELSRDRVDVAQYIYKTLAEWTRKFAANNNDTTLIVRPHPGSNLDKIKQDFGEETESVRYIKGGSIPPWIIASDRYVTRASTSIMEAWIADVPTALIHRDKTIDQWRARPHLREAETTLDSYSEFEKFIVDGGREGSRDKHHEFLSSHYRLDGRSALRTAKELQKIASKQPDSVRYSEITVENMLEHTKFLIKKFVNESGLNRWNPFDRPNGEFMSQDRARKIVDSITDELNLNGKDEAVQ